MAKTAPTIVPANSPRFTVAENANPKLKLPIIAWSITDKGHVTPITPEGLAEGPGLTVLFDDRTLSGKKLKKFVLKAVA